jgi:hypothetical protein
MADETEDFLCHERVDAKGEPHKLCAGHAQRTKGRRRRAVRAALEREVGDVR